ncbi:MAG: hypothetical protein M3P49_14035, partial [Actinomycetota bacterium]|nr:hypothetical protein [Actinomycetota bacterium]
MALNGGHDAALPRRPNEAEHRLSGRAIGCLRAAGIGTVDEFAERSAAELLAIPNFGSESLGRTQAFLAGLGLELSEAPDGSPRRGIGRRRIDPGVEEKLRSAGLWDARMPGGAAPGTRLRDLLRAPGVSGKEELDRLLSALAARGGLPKPRGMNEFLGLLAACGGAREALGAARMRLARGPRNVVVGEDAALDAVGRLLDAAREEIARGTLHEGALLDWPPLAALNARLTPEERTLPGLLAMLVRMPGLGPPGDQARRAEEALSSHGTLDDELRTLLSEVLRLDGRKRLVMLGCFSWEGRQKLRKLGGRFNVSRERVRQIKVGVARCLADAHERLPLPRLRTAEYVAEDLCREDRLRRVTGEPRRGVAEERVHAELSGRGVARSAEATRHALAALGALSYARKLESENPTGGSLGRGARAEAPARG